MHSAPGGLFIPRRVSRPGKPIVTRDDIRAAHGRIRTHVRRTPVIALEPGAFGLDARLVLKLESLQHTGSFKPRGAFNRILSNPVPPTGVIAASGGNHGIAVAYAAKALGHRAEVFVPEIASAAKVQRIREHGASVVVTPGTYAESLEASGQRAGETGALVVHAYDQPEVLAGQGTVAMELEEQAPDLDTLLVAVGGGGLLGGIASWYERRVRIVGVETEGCPALYSALKAGRPVDVDVGGIAADSLGARRIGSLAWELLRAHAITSQLVSDEDVVAAQRALWREVRVVAEPGGAVALAAILSGAYRPHADETVGVLVCGGNADPLSVM